VVAVVLLRAANLGARNRVPMATFRAILEEVGGEDVRTYVQSGNAVLRTRLSAAALEAAVESGIRRELGHELTVVVRTAAQMRRVAGDSPFTEAHVAFLAAKPAAARVRALESRDFRADRAKVVGKDVYLHYPTGVGRSPLSNATIERILGVPATTRNWRTVTALAELSRG